MSTAVEVIKYLLFLFLFIFVVGLSPGLGAAATPYSTPTLPTIVVGSSNVTVGDALTLRSTQTDSRTATLQWEMRVAAVGGGVFDFTTSDPLAINGAHSWVIDTSVIDSYKIRVRAIEQPGGTRDTTLDSPWTSFINVTVSPILPFSTPTLPLIITGSSDATIGDVLTVRSANTDNRTATLQWEMNISGTGQQVAFTTSGALAKNGTHSWTLDTSVANTYKVRVRAIEKAGGTRDMSLDSSWATITVYINPPPPYSTPTLPSIIVGSSSVITGDVVTVRSANTDSRTATLQWEMNISGTSEQVAFTTSSALTQNGTHSWTLDTSVANTYKVRVRTIEKAGSTRDMNLDSPWTSITVTVNPPPPYTEPTLPTIVVGGSPAIIGDILTVRASNTDSRPVTLQWEMNIDGTGEQVAFTTTGPLSQNASGDWSIDTSVANTYKVRVRAIEQPGSTRDMSLDSPWMTITVLVNPPPSYTTPTLPNIIVGSSPATVGDALMVQASNTDSRSVTLQWEMNIEGTGEQVAFTTSDPLALNESSEWTIDASVANTYKVNVRAIEKPGSTRDMSLDSPWAKSTITINPPPPLSAPTAPVIASGVEPTLVGAPFSVTASNTDLRAATLQWSVNLESSGDQVAFGTSSLLNEGESDTWQLDTSVADAYKIRVRTIENPRATRDMSLDSAWMSIRVLVTNEHPLSMFELLNMIENNPHPNRAILENLSNLIYDYYEGMAEQSEKEAISLAIAQLVILMHDNINTPFDELTEAQALLASIEVLILEARQLIPGSSSTTGEGTAFDLSDPIDGGSQGWVLPSSLVYNPDVELTIPIEVIEANQIRYEQLLDYVVPTPSSGLPRWNLWSFQRADGEIVHVFLDWRRSDYKVGLRVYRYTPGTASRELEVFRDTKITVNDPIEPVWNKSISIWDGGFDLPDTVDPGTADPNVLEVFDMLNGYTGIQCSTTIRGIIDKLLEQPQKANAVKDLVAELVNRLNLTPSATSCPEEVSEFNLQILDIFNNGAQSRLDSCFEISNHILMAQALFQNTDGSWGNNLGGIPHVDQPAYQLLMDAIDYAPCSRLPEARDDVVAMGAWLQQNPTTFVADDVQGQALMNQTLNSLLALRSLTSRNWLLTQSRIDYMGSLFRVFAALQGDLGSSDVAGDFLGTSGLLFTDYIGMESAVGPVSGEVINWAQLIWEVRSETSYREATSAEEMRDWLSQHFPSSDHNDRVDFVLAWNIRTPDLYLNP